MQEHGTKTTSVWFVWPPYYEVWPPYYEAAQCNQKTHIRVSSR